MAFRDDSLDILAKLLVPLLNSSGIHKGANNGYGVLPTSALQSPIPAGTKLVILTSNSCGWQDTEDNVNNPVAQANLTSFVQNGGVLVMHMADNYLEDNFVAPSGVTVDQSEDSYTTQLVDPQHPIALGPDGIAGTRDDLTDAILSQELEFQAQGTLELPAGALPIINSPSGAPVLAEYKLGSGRVIVSTFTEELWEDYGIGARQVMRNEFAYAVKLTMPSAPPTIKVPGNIVVDATDIGTVVRFGTPTAVDASGKPLPVSVSPASGSAFPLGTTTVLASTVDSNGLRATAAFTVTCRVSFAYLRALTILWGTKAGHEKVLVHFIDEAEKHYNHAMDELARHPDDAKKLAHEQKEWDKKLSEYIKRVVAESHHTDQKDNGLTPDRSATLTALARALM